MERQINSLESLIQQHNLPEETVENSIFIDLLPYARDSAPLWKKQVHKCNRIKLLSASNLVV